MAVESEAQSATARRPNGPSARGYSKHPKDSLGLLSFLSPDPGRSLQSGNSAQASQSGGNGNNTEQPSGSQTQQDSRFECNICLDTAQDAVVSACGHLFCWPCLHQWLETRPNRQVCPVCKSAISKEKVIPLYGRGGNQSDPREKVPPRPQGQRTEHASGFPGFNFDGGGGFQLSFGIGAFPLSFFTSTFSFGDNRPQAPPQGSRQYEEEQWLSKVFLWVAIFFIFWLLVA